MPNVPDSSIPFQEEDALAGIFKYTLRFLRWGLWKHRYRPIVKLWASKKFSFFAIFFSKLTLISPQKLPDF